MRILIIHSLLLGAAICSSLNAYDVLNPIGGISPPEPPGPVPASYPHWVFDPNPSHDGTFENAFQDIEYLSRYSRRIHHRGITQSMNGILILENEPTECYRVTDYCQSKHVTVTELWKTQQLNGIWTGSWVATFQQGHSIEEDKVVDTGTANSTFLDEYNSVTLRTIDEEFGVVNPANPGVLPGAGALLVFTSIIYDHDRQGANSWSSVDRFARDLLVTETPGILVIGDQDSIVTEGWSYEETGPQRELLGNYPPFSWSITFYSATNHFQNPESNESSWGEMEESDPRVLTQYQYVSRPQRILGF